jgi:hypothetical protein
MFDLGSLDPTDTSKKLMGEDTANSLEGFKYVDPGTYGVTNFTMDTGQLGSDYFNKKEGYNPYAGADNGMTEEYLKGLDKLYWQKYGRGMKGSFFDKLKHDRNLANDFAKYLNLSTDQMLGLGGDEISKLVGYGLVTNEQYQQKQLQDQADAKDPIKQLPKNITGALEGGLITQDQADQLNKLMGAGQGDAASSLLSQWAQAGVIPKYEFKKTDAMQQAENLLNQQMNSSPTFNNSIVDQWMSYLDKSSSPVMQDELKSAKGTMNARGILDSSVSNRALNDIITKYNTNNLNSAMNYGYQDYQTQLNNKQAAIDKNLSLQQYYEQMGRVNSDQQRDDAWANLMKSWTDIEGANKRDYSIQDLLTNQSFQNEDWEKNSDLMKWISQLQANSANGAANSAMSSAGLGAAGSIVGAVIMAF